MNNNHETMMRELQVLDKLGDRNDVSQDDLLRICIEYGTVMWKACELGQPVEFIAKMLYLNFKSTKQTKQMEFSLEVCSNVDVPKLWESNSEH